MEYWKNRTCRGEAFFASSKIFPVKIERMLRPQGCDGVTEFWRNRIAGQI